MARRRKFKPLAKNSNNTLALFVLLLIAFLVVVGMTSTPAVTDTSATGEVRLVITQPPAEGTGEVGIDIADQPLTNN